MRKDSVAAHKLTTKPEARPIPVVAEDTSRWPSQLPSRADVLKAVQAIAKPDDAIVATTGYTGRELYALEDRPNQLYMVGSMGCASSFGLGIALVQKNKRRVIVLDGDGAALMRMGAMATIGYERPSNLIHVLLDNEAHESTGAQSTVSHSVDLAGVARACGYGNVVRATSLDKLGKTIADARELTFVHVKIKTGAPDDLPRPTITPVEVAERMRKFLST
jgi:phosphonopyruvate decarboxylase